MRNQLLLASNFFVYIIKIFNDSQHLHQEQNWKLNLRFFDVIMKARSVLHLPELYEHKWL